MFAYCESTICYDYFYLFKDSCVVIFAYRANNEQIICYRKWKNGAFVIQQHTSFALNEKGDLDPINRAINNARALIVVETRLRRIISI